MTQRALDALRAARVVLGYRTYVHWVQPLLHCQQEVIASGMGEELERCRQALDLAQSGRRPVLVSGGDPGIYGMAGPVMELQHREGSWPDVEVEIIPGITAASAAAAVLGAPLMQDFAVISLSDLLVDRETICRRLRGAAQADLVLALYNPASRRRQELLGEVRSLLLQYRPPATPVGVVRRGQHPDQKVLRTDLGSLEEVPVDMASLVLVGNSETRWEEGAMITPRGYDL